MHYSEVLCRFAPSTVLESTPVLCYAWRALQNEVLSQRRPQDSHYGRVDESRVHMFKSAYVSAGHLSSHSQQLHCSACHSTSTMLSSKYPYTASPPLKNLSVAAVQKRAANLSYLHNTTVKISIAHQDLRSPYIPTNKTGTTNHRHVSQCSIPRQQRPVPVPEFEACAHQLWKGCVSPLTALISLIRSDYIMHRRYVPYYTLCGLLLSCPMASKSDS